MGLGEGASVLPTKRMEINPIGVSEMFLRIAVCVTHSSPGATLSRTTESAGTRKAAP